MLISTIIILISLLLPVTGLAQDAAPEEENLSELDKIMREVLETRMTDWKTRNNYIFREHETFLLQAASVKLNIYSIDHEYAWYVKDGYLIRCLDKVDGIELSPEEKQRSEDNWIEHIKEESKEGNLGLSPKDFFGFEFEDGSFYFKGNETWRGRDVWVVEFYPDVEVGDELAEMEDDDHIDRMMENSVYNTMWILPEERRIVKMQINTSDLDFLPGRWLIQVKSAGAVMEMTEAYPGIWLPGSIEVAASSMTAQGPVSFEFRQDFDQFARAQVKVNFYVEPDSLFNRSKEEDDNEDK